MNVTLAALTATIKVKAINDRDFIYNNKEGERNRMLLGNIKNQKTDIYIRYFYDFFKSGAYERHTLLNFRIGVYFSPSLKKRHNGYFNIDV